jgi:hypothetical protein
MSRKERKAWAWLRRNIVETELYNVLRGPDGLALRVVIRSIRAEELFRNLHRDVFSPDLEMPIIQLEKNGVRSACFSYSEPLNPSTPLYFKSMVDEPRH